MRPASPNQILRLADAPAFLITNLINIRYLIGQSVSAGVILALPRKLTLFVDARYGGIAVSSCSGIAVKDLSELHAAMCDLRRCGFEAEDVTVRRLESWTKKFPKIRFVPTAGVLQSFRRQKEEDELRCIRRAHRITRELLRRVPSALRRRITEGRLARQLLQWALELGADGLSFDPIVAFGTHTSCPHHRPTGRVLQKGHIVQIDVGAKCNGYCADMSEVFFTATPAKTEAQVYRALRVSQRKAIHAIRPGASNREIDRIAREILKKAGIERYFVHSLGHGVGLEIHEGVSLSQKAPEQKLLRNEVVTVEPGVYLPGKFGMRVEDMIYVQ